MAGEIRLGTSSFTLDEDFSVRDRARDLQREDEAGRRLERPIIDRFYRRAAVERRIHLDRVEARRIVSKISRGLHATRIERAGPAGSSECGGSKTDFSRHGSVSHD